MLHVHAYVTHTQCHVIICRDNISTVSLANQKTIVELISVFKKATPPHILSSNKATPTEDTPTQQNTGAVVAMVMPTQTEISLELEKLSIRTLTSGRGQDTESTSLFAASFEFYGLGIQTCFGTEITIDGFMEGVKILDLTPEGKLYPTIVSLGACREGRDMDMITTMMTSYDSLRKMSDCVHFSMNRIQRLQESSTSPARQLFDLHISAHVPSILYTHSVNFIQEMQLFAVNFLRYFDDISKSMKTAALGVARGLVREKSQLAGKLSQLSTSFGGRYVSMSLDEEEDQEETDMGGVVGVDDRVLVNILVKSPVVVLPSSLCSEDTLVAHLGEISIENCYINKEHETQTETDTETQFILSSHEVDQMILKVSNVTLHSSHDPASRCWLISEIQDESPCVSGHWHKVLNETSFVVQVERAVSGCGLSTSPQENDSDEMVDVKVHCHCSNSVFVSLPNSVFDQLKRTIKHGLYRPNNEDIPHMNNLSSSSIDVESTATSVEGLPKIYCSFSLSRLSIEMKHLIGTEVKDIVFISFDDFVARGHKTTPYHTHFDLALKSVIIEDLLQTNEMYRYILSSTMKPLPFSSPVSTPSSSLYSHGMGISPRPLLPLMKLISSPKPPKSSYSPLRSFNPFVETPPPTDGSNSNRPMTPPADISSSSVTDVQDVVSIKVTFVSEDCPDFSSRYNSISLNTNITFSTVFLVVNLQTWVLLFDYLGIGVPTPPSSPSHSPPTFDFSPVDEDGLGLYSLKPDGSVYITSQNKPDPETSRTSSRTTPEKVEMAESQRSTVWGAEGKLSVNVSLKVQSLTVTFNKPEHPLARGTASNLRAEVTLCQSNVRLKGSLKQATLIDLTGTGAYYRERLTTSGDQALSFDIFK